MNGKFFATGGKTKTGKEATLPPSLGPNKDLVRKGKHSRIFIRASTGGRTREVLDHWQPYNIGKWMRAELGLQPGLD